MKLEGKAISIDSITITSISIRPEAREAVIEYELRDAARMPMVKPQYLTINGDGYATANLMQSVTAWAEGVASPAANDLLVNVRDLQE
jgi:hypothetical protein